MERKTCADAVGALPEFVHTIECRDARGRLRWREKHHNLVTIQGQDFGLATIFKGVAYTAAWFVGLIDAAGYSAVSEADTAASHPGWSENQAYSQTTRVALVLGTPAAGEVDNSASLATFTINANGTIQGSFVSTQSVKGSTGGTLYSASSFGTPRVVLSGDIITVEVSEAL